MGGVAENANRRNLLRDAALEVLSAEGSRGLTHRAVDGAAGVPSGTAKNYFPTRDALLAAVAERCLELFRQAGTLPTGATGPTGREDFAALLRGLLAEATGPGRRRVLAYLELHGEASRKPWLGKVLAEISAMDFATMDRLQRSAGFDVTPQRARVVTMAVHAAVVDLLAHPPGVPNGAGLDDLDAFVGGLLDVVYPRSPTDG